MQRVCSVPCAAKVGRLDREKKAEKLARAKTKVARENLKTITDHKRDTQAIFNQYIRLRDMHKPCISCQQSPYQGQRHASHFRSRSAASQLSYNFLQVRASCAQCNGSKSGNISEFRIALAKILTPGQLAAIENNNDKAVFDKPYLKRIQGILKRRIRHYKRLRGV
jgi:hypothetical protein